MGEGVLQRLLSWLLYTSIFAAACATALCMATERLLLGEAPPLVTGLHILVFCSTLLVYNAHYLVKHSTPALSDRFRWSQQYRAWHYVLLSLGTLGCIYAIFHLPPSILYACAVLGALSFAYSLPLLPFNKARLRELGWLKILVLAAVWTIVTSILPMLYWNKPIVAYPFEIALRAVFIFTLCIAFDIRDMQTDLHAGIITLPNVIGIKMSYRLMDVALLLFVVFSVIQYVRYPSIQRLSAEIVIAILTKLAISFTKKYPSDKAYLGLIDGMMLLYGILILL